MEDTWYEIPEVAAHAQRIVPDASIKATYSAGPAFLEQTGKPASLWLGVCNSSLNDRSRQEMEPVARALSEVALAWLRERNLAAEDTTIEVAFADSSQRGPFSHFNALETFVFEVKSDGGSQMLKPDISDQAQRAFRAFRYWLSGRKLP